MRRFLVSDVVGYGRARRRRTKIELWRDCARCATILIDPTISVHHGRIIKRTGDGGVIEFRSVVDAVRCALELQHAMVERNAPGRARQTHRISHRLIHLGDVVEDNVFTQYKLLIGLTRSRAALTRSLTNHSAVNRADAFISVMSSLASEELIAAQNCSRDDAPSGRRGLIPFFVRSYSALKGRVPKMSHHGRLSANTGHSSEGQAKMDQIRSESRLPISAAFDGNEEVRDGAHVPQRHAHDLDRIDDDRGGRGRGGPQTRGGRSAKWRPAMTSSSSASSSSRRW